MQHTVNVQTKGIPKGGNGEGSSQFPSPHRDHSRHDFALLNITALGN